jgi:hypothetical protein
MYEDINELGKVVSYKVESSCGTIQSTILSRKPLEG